MNKKRKVRKVRKPEKFSHVFDDGERAIKKIEGRAMKIYLEDGVILTVKFSVAQVRRRMGQFNDAGEPIYQVDFVAIGPSTNVVRKKCR